MNGNQMTRRVPNEDFDITDPIERAFETWYGQQFVESAGEWLHTPNVFIAISHDMSQEDRQRLAQFLMGQVQGEVWGPYRE